MSSKNYNETGSVRYAQRRQAAPGASLWLLLGQYMRAIGQRVLGVLVGIFERLQVGLGEGPELIDVRIRRERHILRLAIHHFDLADIHGLNHLAVFIERD